MSSLTSSRQEEYNSSYTVYLHSMNTRLINEYFTGNSAIGYALVESAEWQEAMMLNLNWCKQMMFEHQTPEHYRQTTYRCTQSKTMFRYLLIFPPRKKWLSLLFPALLFSGYTLPWSVTEFAFLQVSDSRYHLNLGTYDLLGRFRKSCIIELMSKPLYRASR